MIHEPSSIAVVVFGLFVAVTLGLSFYLGRKARTAAIAGDGHSRAHDDALALDGRRRGELVFSQH